VAACVYGYEAKKEFRFIEEHLGKGLHEVINLK
jgi:hypothetical protein